MEHPWICTLLHHHGPVTFLLLILLTSATARKDANGVPLRSSHTTRKSSVRKEPGRAPFESPLTAKEQVIKLLHVQKLKKQILRGLNLSSEPKPTASVPVSAQPIPSIVSSRTVSSSHNRLFPGAIVWSEPVDEGDGNSDELLFRMANHKTKSDVINRVKLFLRLRSKQRRRKGKLKTSKKKKVKAIEAAPKSELQNDQEKSKKERRGKKGRKRRMRRGKPRRVKVLVQAIHEKSGRYKRVAVQRVTLNSKFRWVSLPIPATLVSRAVASANHTLVLRVKCKRCPKGKVSIVFPRKRNKKRLKNMGMSGDTSLNPKRPYLAIHTAQTALGSDSSAP